MVFLVLLLFVPLSLALAFLFHAPPPWVFVTSCVAIVPLAELMRRATEELAVRAGPAVGGLVTVSFGSLTGLILSVFVLRAGQVAVVKAQIIGSIIVTSLLGLGLAIIAGSWRRGALSFDARRAGRYTSLLILSVIALLIPALFDYAERGVYAVRNAAALDESLSVGVSVVLIAVYLANVSYTLVTRRETYEAEKSRLEKAWPVWKSLCVLCGGTALVAAEADLVSDSLAATVERAGLSPLFMGIIVFAVIASASDLVAAVYFALEGRMGLVISICVGSSTQVALMVAPLLVLASLLTGQRMNLVFTNPLQLIAVAGVAFTVNAVVEDGEATWFGGLLLVAVYCLLGLAFFFMSA
jgi:Ca2+:H+ antiporter